MSTSRCWADLIFHITVVSPLADFIGSTGGGKVAKACYRDDAIRYLSGYYNSDLMAPDWIQEVFRKAHCWELKEIMKCKTVSQAYGKLHEFRGILVRRWAEARHPKEPAPKPAASPKKMGRRRKYDESFIQGLIGLSIKEAASRFGMSANAVRLIMFREGLTVKKYGGKIIRK